MKAFLKHFLVIFGLGAVFLSVNANDKPSFMSKILGKKESAPVGKEIRPMTPEEIAALAPTPKEPTIGKKIGTAVGEYVAEKIIPGYKKDLEIITNISNELAIHAKNLQKQSEELKKAFPLPDFKRAAIALPGMFNDFKQFAGINIMLAQVQAMLRKIQNTVAKDDKDAFLALDKTIKSIDDVKKGLSYVWDLPNGIAATLREIAKNIEAMFAPVNTRARSGTVVYEPVG